MKLKLEGSKKCHYQGRVYLRGETLDEFIPGAIKFLKRVGWVEVLPVPEPEPEPEPFIQPEKPLRPSMVDPNEPDPEPSVYQRRRGRQPRHN